MGGTLGWLLIAWMQKRHLIWWIGPIWWKHSRNWGLAVNLFQGSQHCMLTHLFHPHKPRKICTVLLNHGTHQGSPLSPLLFAVATEPLVINIRNHTSVEPIQLGNVDIYISLYVDDVVIFQSHPENSVPVLLDHIKSFGEVSGYRINWQKSKFMSLGAEFFHNLPFKINNKLNYRNYKL